MKNKVIFPFILLMLSLDYFFISCVKNTDCKATVTCVNTNGAPVQNAAVQLYATVKTGSGTNTGTVIADIKANGVTDGTGNVSFVFKLPAIYDILATTTVVNTSTNSTGPTTLTGTGIIKLEEGSTVQKSVTLQ